MTRLLQEETEDPPSDSDTLKETIMLYGPLFVIVWLSLCCCKRCCPKAYNLRTWVPALECNLATKTYGFISWTWRVYSVSDDEILYQCGMDALCLCRAVSYAEKLSLIGILISIFLLPIYKLSPPPTGEDAVQITDPVAQLTIANVPEGSNRFLATVVASYIFYISAWLLLSRDFQWLTKNRIKFLSEEKPRNYSIYVSGIPRVNRTNQALSEYFGNMFNQQSSVYQSNVALYIPRLERMVASRDEVVHKLEHCLALQAINGTRPTHREHGPLGEVVDSIDTYQQELDELNAQVSADISMIDDARQEGVDDGHVDESKVVEKSRQDSFYSCKGNEDVELGVGSEQSSIQGESLECPLSRSASGGLKEVAGSIDEADSSDADNHGETPRGTLSKATTWFW